MWVFLQSTILTKLKPKIEALLSDPTDPNKYQRNLVKLEIYYEEFNFEKISEQPTYSVSKPCYSNNIVIKTITWMGMASCHSRIGANTRHLHACFGMNASNVDSYWKRYVDSNRQLEHKCLLVNNLIGIRDSVAIEDISLTHCRELIEFLCTCE